VLRAAVSTAALTWSLNAAAAATTAAAAAARARRLDTSSAPATERAQLRPQQGERVWCFPGRALKKKEKDPAVRRKGGRQRQREGPRLFNLPLTCCAARVRKKVRKSRFVAGSAKGRNPSKSVQRASGPWLSQRPGCWTGTRSERASHAGRERDS